MRPEQGGLPSISKVSVPTRPLRDAPEPIRTASGTGKSRTFGSMKIVIDDKIPFIRGIFEPYADVAYLPGGAIDATAVREADALVIRTRTRCDAALLEGSRVRMIATATIGYDHIDTAYCRARNIRVATAAGCNARGVLQWVCAALLAMRVRPEGTTLGIVGAGHVGGAVQRTAEAAGFETLCCDPPRKMRHEPGTERFVSLPELLRRADAVTVHVLLDETTRGMISDEFFAAMKPGAVFLNSSRGEVVDETALKRALRNGRVSAAAIDVWNGEPQIDRALLSAAAIATPHIAGYSLQGKAMGTAMSVRAVAAFLGLPIAPDWYPAGLPARPRPIDPTWDEIASGMAAYYDIRQDDAALRAAPERFEELRGDYRFREEFF